MKTGRIIFQFVFTIVLCFVFQTSTRAQGTLSFQNGSSSRVCLHPGDQWVPAGSTFLAELMYAPDGTSADLFDAVAVRLGAPASFTFPGIFIGGTRTAPIVVPGGFGLFEVRVWEAAYGTDYRSAAASQIPARIGKSEILRIDTDDPTAHAGGEDTETHGFPTSLIHGGLRTFTVGYPETGPCVIPEPSTIALGLLGLATLFLVRSRGSR